MAMDAKWYAGWVRLLPASTVDEKMRNLEAADMLEELDRRVPRWISVEERLPESYISVIGYLPIEDKEGHPPTREVYRTEKGWFAPALSELCIVTHWQPLPEPPEEVQNE